MHYCTFVKIICAIYFCFITVLDNCNAEMFRAEIHGPGLHEISMHPGIANFYTKDLEYFEMVQYLAHPTPTSRADLEFYARGNELVKSFHIAGYSSGEICSLLEQHGFKRLDHKKKSAEDLMADALRSGRRVEFQGKVYSSMDEFQRKYDFPKGSQQKTDL